MARPIWKGDISFGLVNIPVTLYSAEQRSDLHFNRIDSRNHARIRYERVNEETGEEVPWNEIIKGFEYDGGDYVLLSDEDFRKAAPEASQTVEIQSFVDQDAVDYVYFDKPYYLVPGKKGRKGYVLLRKTLQRTGTIGIAKVVIRTREYLAAVIPQGSGLVLNLLRFAQELRDADEFELPDEDIDSYNISKKKMDMAEKLVKTMSAKWDPQEYQDTYRERLMKLIEKKAAGGKMAEIPEPEEEAAETDTQVINIMDLLKKSVERRGKLAGKSARKPTAARRTSGAGKKTKKTSRKRAS